MDHTSVEGLASLDNLLTIEQIREIVDRWSSQGLLRVRGLGTRMVIQDRINYDCFTVRLRSQVEKRATTQETVPYRGEALDTMGRPPDPWDLPASPPRDFEERTERMPVPHTDRVERCRGCFGDGHVRCTKCHGDGRVDCTWCDGKGYRTRTRTVSTTQGGPGPDTGIGPGIPTGGVTRTEEVREDCSSCDSGRVRCTKCSGDGRCTCPTCQGAGQVKHFQQLTVAFDIRNQEDVVYEGGLPEHLVLQLEGEEVFDRRADRLPDVGPLAPRVDERLRELLRASQDPSADTRLHFQHLRVEKTLVHKVVYNYQDDTPRDLWIYGPDHRVHAPGAPWRWGLLVALLAGGAALVVGGIVLITLL